MRVSGKVAVASEALSNTIAISVSTHVLHSNTFQLDSSLSCSLLSTGDKMLREEEAPTGIVGGQGEDSALPCGAEIPKAQSSPTWPSAPPKPSPPSSRNQAQRRSSWQNRTEDEKTQARSLRESITHTMYAESKPVDYPVSYTHLTLPTICSV